MDKTSFRVLTLTVGCMLFLSTTAEQVIAWPCPPCPDCETCTPTGCECQADCGCGGKTCTGCCECVDCSCDPNDSECGDPNCWDCNSSCGCECDITVNSVSSDDYACIDCDVTFTAVLDEGSCSCVDWSGGGDPASQDGGCSFTTKWDSPGVKTVTATPDCGDSKQKQVTIVKVASLLPDAGTEFDDGDADPDTKSFAVCIADSGVVTVTATPNPSVAEADLPGCWTLVGGTGSGKLTRTVDKTTAGTTVITCTAGSSSKTTTIYVIEVTSLLPDQGTEFDDGDGDPNTKSYTVCIADSGVVTVTATPNPNIREPNLPTCWNYTGGTTVNNVKHTVDKTTAGLTTLTCTAGSSSKTTKIYVGKVKITEPDENPVTDNNFAFNSASPGVCNVTATGTTGVSSLNEHLQWTLGAISGSTQTSNPDPPKGPSITFTYTTLPSSNSEFGQKSLTVTHPNFPAGCNNDTNNVEIFFSRDAYNHTGAGAGTTRNWYYYWKQGSVVSDLTQFGYQDQGGYGAYYPGTGNLYVRNAAPTSNASYNVTNKVTQQVETIGANGVGIDCCAETCTHELKHKWIDDNWSSLPDSDNDGIPDSQEGIAPYYFDINDPDTYNLAGTINPGYASVGDQEFLAWKAEQNPGSVDASKDWSDTNGKQWNK